MNRKFLTLGLALVLIAASPGFAAVAGATTTPGPAASVTAETPTTLTIDPISPFPYWEDVTLTGHLMANPIVPTGDVVPLLAGEPLAARGLLIEHSRDGGLTWPDVQWVTTRFDGTWAYIYDPSSSWERNHRVRIRYMGEEGDYAASTATVWVSMTLSLARPTKNVATVYHDQIFTLTSTIKPRFAAGIDAARAYFYKRRATGGYVLFKTVRMRSYYLSTTATTLRHSTFLTDPGMYRVRLRYAGGLAAYNGAQYATTYSPYYYFTVK